MGWSSQAVIATTVIVEGPNDGIFEYDAAGNLRSANVAQTTTDPNQGITCYAGYSTFNGRGAVISLFSSTLDAQLWYADTGSSSQGALTSSIASALGVDPFGNHFVQGIADYNSGTVIQINTTAITFYVTSDLTPAQINGRGGILDLDSGVQTAGTDMFATLLGSTSSPNGVAQAMFSAGNSSPVTAALVEVQGVLAFSGSDTAPSAPSPPQALANGTAAQLSDTTRDYMIYFVPSGAGNLTIQIGSTSAVGRTILPTSAVVAGALYSVRIPAGWFVKWTGTGTVALASQTVVGC